MTDHQIVNGATAMDWRSFGQDFNNLFFVESAGGILAETAVYLNESLSNQRANLGPGFFGEILAKDSRKCGPLLSFGDGIGLLRHGWFD
jgi:hypothetical protein